MNVTHVYKTSQPAREVSVMHAVLLRCVECLLATKETIPDSAGVQSQQAGPALVLRVFGQNVAVQPVIHLYLHT